MSNIYNANLQNNNTQLNSILDQINSLPVIISDYKNRMQEVNTVLQTILNDVNSLPEVPLLPSDFSECSWEQIITACNTHTVPASWKIGDYHLLSMSDGMGMLRIIGKEIDPLSDNSGTAALTLQLFSCPISLYTNFGSTGNSWATSSARAALRGSFGFSKLPTNLQNNIKTVNKTSAGVTTEETLFLMSQNDTYPFFSDTTIFQGGFTFFPQSSQECYLPSDQNYHFVFTRDVISNNQVYAIQDRNYNYGSSSLSLTQRDVGQAGLYAFIFCL